MGRPGGLYNMSETPQYLKGLRHGGGRTSPGGSFLDLSFGTKGPRNRTFVVRDGLRKDS